MKNHKITLSNGYSIIFHKNSELTTLTITPVLNRLLNTVLFKDVYVKDPSGLTLVDETSINVNLSHIVSVVEL